MVEHPTYHITKPREGKGLKLIFNHTPDVEAHARQHVKQLLDRVNTGRPLIPSIDEAHFPMNCYACGKRVWAVDHSQAYCDEKCRKEYLKD